jgi:heme exporter protein A
VPLRLCNITRFYGQKLIFKNVSLDLHPGQIILLCGPNGAGKSTLLKIMAGLIKPSQGKIIFSTADNSPPDRGYLDHQTFIYPQLSALENLRFWADLHGCDTPDSDIISMLERMRLAAFADEKAGSFSRGMAQRLNLARVFLPRPALLLLDEPASGLDQASLALLRNEIKRAGNEGACIVWITHNPDEDRAWADKIAMLDNKCLQFYVDVDAFPAELQKSAHPSDKIPRKNMFESGALC